jgi:hypothetical protein
MSSQTQREKVIDDLHSLLTFKGCVTNGEIWIFFIFSAAETGEGGSVSISKEFRLEEDLSGLPIVLGLLNDWVSSGLNRHFTSFKNFNLVFIQITNSKEREQRFFTYLNS